MFLKAVPPSAVALIGFTAFAILLLVTFAVAYAKRDVKINITLFEFHR